MEMVEINHAEPNRPKYCSGIEGPPERGCGGAAADRDRLGLPGLGPGRSRFRPGRGGYCPGLHPGAGGRLAGSGLSGHVGP